MTVSNSNCTRCRATLFVVAAIFLLSPKLLQGHCDSVEGPVVHDAQLALQGGDPTPILKWVGKEHEAEIQNAFKESMTLRVKGDEAKALADRYFFETLVRLHRAGEGEAFTGLKPNDSVAPGILAADKALEAGSVKELSQEMSAAVGKGIQKRFDLVLERKKHAADSVEAGRKYVEAYVDYIHYMENLARLTSHGAEHPRRESNTHGH